MVGQLSVCSKLYSCTHSLGLCQADIVIRSVLEEVLVVDVVFSRWYAIKTLVHSVTLQPKAYAPVPINQTGPWDSDRMPPLLQSEI